jgi:hypothetical protein
MRFPFAVVLMVLVTGCAQHGGEAVSAAAQSEGSALPGSALPKDNALTGMWQGSFGQVQTGDSGLVHGDILCQINKDGTYTTTWTTKLVAGSSRRKELQMTGTVLARGSSVSFDDSRSGSRMTLRRDGDTLYGVTIDPQTKRVTVAVELHKVPTAPQAP